MILNSSKLIFFIIAIVALAFVQCVKNDELSLMESYSTYQSPDMDGLTYLALGDSYTKAECEAEENSYPAKLWVKMGEDGFKLKKRITIAQTGWRTDNLKSAIQAAALQDTFDIVSLLIGVNNQFQGRSADAYRIEYRELLEMAIYYARGRKDKVFVLSIPDYGVTPFGSPNEAAISQQIDLFNHINKEITDSLGVKYFDITPISREAKSDGSLLCIDNLHPSGKMYSRWVDHIYPDVLMLAGKR